ncbi:hypothetical protein [Carboxylicivirga sp. N1Y90]|uniref:hypothetical protein n=1 Tax=Carboxylicivirga fragile TaxID=3417571 RepID=UPI003D3438F8|nr:hypothetical protein [Marinilabiliaceae bacterium N1Y90]
MKKIDDLKELIKENIYDFYKYDMFITIDEDNDYELRRGRYQESHEILCGSWLVYGHADSKYQDNQKEEMLSDFEIDNIEIPEEVNDDYDDVDDNEKYLLEEEFYRQVYEHPNFIKAVEAEENRVIDELAEVLIFKFEEKKEMFEE